MFDSNLERRIVILFPKDACLEDLDCFENDEGVNNMEGKTPYTTGYFEVEGIRQPHRCPVCGGNGLVPSGFYDQVSGEWWSSDASPETCRTCNGTGIVWG